MRCCLIVALLTGVVCAEEPSKPVDRIPVRIPGQTAEQLKLRRQHHDRMAKPIDVAFKETPLNEAVAEIFQKIDVSVRWDEISFEEWGVSLDEPITMTLKQCPARTVLALIERELELDHYLRADGVTIGPSGEIDEWGRSGELWIFDVSAILNARDRWSLTVAHEDPFLEARVWMTPEGRHPKTPPAVESRGQDQQGVYERLTALLSGTTGPNGDLGEDGMLTLVQHSLIARMSNPQLREVSRCLDTLASLLVDDEQLVVQSLYPEDRIAVDRYFRMMNELVMVDAKQQPVGEIVRTLLEPVSPHFRVDRRGFRDADIDPSLLLRRVTYSRRNLSRRDAIAALLGPFRLAVISVQGVPVVTSGLAADDIEGNGVVIGLRIDDLPIEVARSIPRTIQEYTRRQTIPLERPRRLFLRQIERLSDTVIVIRESEANAVGILLLIKALYEIHPPTEAAPVQIEEPAPLMLKFYQFYCEESAKRQVENLPIMVRANTWKRQGVAISRDGDTVSIRQTANVHRAIQHYLSALEKAPGNRCFFDPRLFGDRHESYLLPNGGTPY